MIPPIPKLEEYGLSSESGFMPAEPPLERLLDPYYAPWETLMDKLHGLLLAGRLREAVLKVPSHPYFDGSNPVAACPLDCVS
jgi:indoleamine 2,3-dioxygenase